jgi:hypothetical protein
MAAQDAETALAFCTAFQRGELLQRRNGTA